MASRNTFPRMHLLIGFVCCDHVTLTTNACEIDSKQLEARLEQATATAQTAVGRAEARTRQLVVGAQFFPLPYIELRPEYRLILSTQDEAGLINEYALGQYTLQVHLFF